MSKAVLLAGLGFGDEGKGTTVEYLVARDKADLVVRYNGGPQAAHHVVRDDGAHHTFAQFGSGTFQGARTHLSRFMLVNPLTLIREGEHLEKLGYDAFKGITVDRECALVTPYHRVINHLREVDRGEARHGTCGMGVGEAVEDAMAYPEDVPRVGDLENPVRLCRKLSFIQELKLEQARGLCGGATEKLAPDDPWLSANTSDLWLSADFLTEIYRGRGFQDRVQFVDRDWLKPHLAKGTTVFEGAQGLLLDQDFGFQPHTTWSNVTFGNAEQLLLENDFTGETTRVGVTRSYQTRHGAGPLPSECRESWVYEPHNGSTGIQGAFRHGFLDLQLLKYALGVQEMDEISLTHLDVAERYTVCMEYNSPEIYEFCPPHGQLLVKRPVEYSYQQALTQALKKLNRSHLKLHEVSAEDLPECVQSNTGVPVTIQSYGPRLCDKRPYP